MRVAHTLPAMKIDFLSDINKGYESDLNYKGADGFIIKVLWWHLGLFSALALINSVGRLAAFYPSPFSWRVIDITEAIVSIGIALVATLVPVMLVGKMKNHYLWRVVVTFALTFYSYLFVFISGGSIEMHFHFFMIIALLVIYADWRLGWVLLVLTALHHGVLNYFEPGWVYFYGRNDVAVISHSLPVLGAVIFTTVLCQTDRGRVVELVEVKGSLEKKVAERTGELKQANASLDQKVTERTHELERLKTGLEEVVAGKTKDLQSKLAQVEELNKAMVGRELKLIEQDKVIDELRQKLSTASS